MANSATAPIPLSQHPAEAEGSTSVAARTFPVLLNRLGQMRDVTKWLDDPDTAGDMLWAAPEQGLATLTHIGGQVLALEDMVRLLAYINDGLPAQAAIPLGQALKVQLARRRVRWPEMACLKLAVPLVDGPALAQASVIAHATFVAAEQATGTARARIQAAGAMSLRLALPISTGAGARSEAFFDPSNPLDLPNRLSLSLLVLRKAAMAGGGQVIATWDTGGVLTIKVAAVAAAQDSAA